MRYYLAVIIALIMISFTSCGKNKELEKLEHYQITQIDYSNKIYIPDSITSATIINNLTYGKEIGPVKGFGIMIEMVNSNDTIHILSYKHSKYFSYNGKNYKSKYEIFPAELSNKILNDIQKTE